MTKTTSKYPNTPDQTKWLRQARRGEAAAFSPIVDCYQRPVYNLCYRMLNDRAAAEDAAQEVFLRAYAKLGTYDESRQFSTWLFAIAGNYCRDQLKRRRLQTFVWEELPERYHALNSDKDRPEPSLLKAEASDEIQDLLAALPANYRTVVILKYWHHLSYEEMAETLKTSVSAIKSQLFRARKQIAGQIERRSVGPVNQLAFGV